MNNDSSPQGNVQPQPVRLEQPLNPPIPAGAAGQTAQPQPSAQSFSQQPMAQPISQPVAQLGVTGSPSPVAQPAFQQQGQTAQATTSDNNTTTQKKSSKTLLIVLAIALVAAIVAVIVIFTLPSGDNNSSSSGNSNNDSNNNSSSSDNGSNSNDASGGNSGSGQGTQGSSSDKEMTQADKTLLHQRDVQRRNDVSRVDMSLVMYQTNHSTESDNLPSGPSYCKGSSTLSKSNEACSFLTNYMNNSASSSNTFTDPSGDYYSLYISENYVIEGDITPKFGNDNSYLVETDDGYTIGGDSSFEEHVVYIIPGGKCNGVDGGITKGKNKRHFAVMYMLEGETIYCLDDD